MIKYLMTAVAAFMLSYSVNSYADEQSSNPQDNTANTQVQQKNDTVNKGAKEQPEKNARGKERANRNFEAFFGVKPQEVNKKNL